MVNIGERLIEKDPCTVYSYPRTLIRTMCTGNSPSCRVCKRDENEKSSMHILPDLLYSI